MQLIIFHYLALIGFLLSAYFLYMKNKKSKNKNYKPICDITKTISCSKAAKSKYSSIAILPNAFYGIIFYIIIFTLSFLQVQYIFYLSIIASIISICLMFISIKIKAFCPVCFSIYVINFVMLYLSYRLR